jgi:hypothetical protein
MSVIIGAPTLESQHPMCDAELQALFAHGTQMVHAAVPDNVPATIPVGSLIRLIATMKKYHTLAKQLGELSVPVTEETMEARVEAMGVLMAHTKALLETPPQLVSDKPKSRLVLPR